MKKIIALFITALLLISSFSFTAFATEEPSFNFEDEYTTILSEKTEITFSDDFKTLYFGNDEYLRFSSQNIYNDMLAELNNKIILSPKQEKEIKEIMLNADKKGVLIGAYIEYVDGATLSSTYIKAEYLEEYNKIIENDFNECVVDFAYPEYNTVKLSANLLSGKTVTIKDIEINVDDYFPVLASSADENLIVEIGIVILSEGDYYYASYKELGTSRDMYFIYDEVSVTAHKITDAKAIESLNAAIKKYYDSDLGFFYDDNFTKKISDIFIILVFGILPFALLVAFTIFAIRSKQIYRKMCIIGASLSAAELIVFIIVALLVI